MRTTLLPSGRPIPLLGQGTWGMGEKPFRRRAEVASLRYGLDLGLALIDTAETYGDGGAEEVVGEAIAGQREEVFLVGKISPHLATRERALEACEASLRRLGTEYIDLYLLHWRGTVPLEESFDALRALKEEGRILEYGVSNFDVDALREAASLPGGDVLATDQVLYNLARRGIEWDLLPWCRDRAIPVMAYSPFEHGDLLRHPALREIAARRGAEPARVALAWLLRQGVIVVAKAARLEHARENRAALDFHLEEEDLESLDRVFPPPSSKVPLEVL
jgi:diketogulonate reductase-like aldo/keto reductase